MSLSLTEISRILGRGTVTKTQGAGLSHPGLSEGSQWHGWGSPKLALISHLSQLSTPPHCVLLLVCFLNQLLIKPGMAVKGFVSNTPTMRPVETRGTDAKLVSLRNGNVPCGNGGRTHPTAAQVKLGNLLVRLRFQSINPKGLMSLLGGPWGSLD